MWKPDKPIVIAGEELSDVEAWWHEFQSEYYELCEGQVECDWLSALVAAVYPFTADLDPRKTAELVMLVRVFEMPGSETG